MKSKRKPLVLKWVKCSDGIWRADTLQGYSFHIVPASDKSSYCLYMNGEVVFPDTLAKGGKTLEECKIFPTKDIYTKVVLNGSRKRIFYKGATEHNSECFEISGLDEVFVYGWISDKFPYETRYEKFVRRSVLMPENIPAASLIFKQRPSPKTIEKKKEVGETYPGKPKEVRNQNGKKPIWAFSEHVKLPALKNAKWRTIRLWAESIFKQITSRHVTIMALENAIRHDSRLASNRKEKAIKRLVLIFASDYKQEKIYVNRDIKKGIETAEKVQEIIIDREEKIVRSEKKKSKHKVSKKKRKQ